MRRYTFAGDGDTEEWLADGGLADEGLWDDDAEDSVCRWCVWCGVGEFLRIGAGGGVVLSTSHWRKRETASQSRYALLGFTRSPREVVRVRRKSFESTRAFMSSKSSTLSSIMSRTESGREG